MDTMKMYADKWQKDYPSNMTQTAMFRKWVPKEGVDFTFAYQSIGFDQIFTSEKVCLKMMGPYNSNMLYRDSLGECKIPIFSDDEFTVHRRRAQNDGSSGRGAQGCECEQRIRASK